MDNQNLTGLIQAREQICRRLETIEASLGDLREGLDNIAAEIAVLKEQRHLLAAKGRRIFALLRETRRELDRHDALIRQVVEEIAEARIGPREGAYLLDSLVIARVSVGGTLYTSLIERMDSG